MSDLVAFSWVLITTWVLNLFQYIILADTYTENSVLQKHLIGKVNSTLIAFSEIGGCYCLILYQNSTSSSFLKVNCIMQLENISTSWQQQASSYSVTLKSMYLFWTLNGFFIHELVPGKILIHWIVENLSNVDTLKIQKNSFINITNFIRKYCNVIKLTYA